MRRNSSARARDGRGGDGFGGGGMVLGEGGGGRMVFAGDGFAVLFFLVWFLLAFTSKKTFVSSLSKIQIVKTFTSRAFISKKKKLFL